MHVLFTEAYDVEKGGFHEKILKRHVLQHKRGPRPKELLHCGVFELQESEIEYV